MRLTALLLLATVLCTAAAEAADPPRPPAAPESPLSRAFKPRILKVGPQQAYKKPSEAAAVARDNDTVEIEAGTYVDCASWKGRNLTLKAAGGEVHLKDKTCEGKAIWVINGDDVLVEGIRFSGAAVRDKNGAGIRVQGAGITIRNAVFENNENGILAAAAPGKRMLIENSTFIGNGKCDPVCAHGIYINQYALLEVRGSTFRNQNTGHHIKSRSLRTVITGNRIEDGSEGTASYLIDISNGGEVTIVRNTLQKGPRSDNKGTAIAIAAEGAKNPTPFIRIEDNVFRSDLPLPPAFVNNRSDTPALLKGNRLCGPVTPLAGPGQVLDPKPCDSR